MKKTEIEKIEKIITEYQKAIYCLADDIYEHPETKYQEYYAYERYIGYLKSLPVDVEERTACIDTAFVASFRQGEAGDCVAFLAEYDALEKMGHGCGHNLLGAASLMAFLASIQYMKNKGIQGEIRLYGCPAEEGGAGKAKMVKAGAFQGVNKVLTWHPADYNAITSGSSLANRQILFQFHGKSAHASIAPHLGRSALDACELMNVGVNYLREHVLPDTRIHYAYQNTGGKSPNIVPEEAEILYQIRAPKSTYVDEVCQRVLDIAQGAALMTGTEVVNRDISRVEELRPCHELEKLLYENMKMTTPVVYTNQERAWAESIVKENGFCTLDDLIERCDNYTDSTQMKEMLSSHIGDPIYNFVVPYMPDDAPHSYSSDVGNVSGVCDTAQFAACTWAANTMEHTNAVVKQGKSTIAHKGISFAATVLAATAIDCI